MDFKRPEPFLPSSPGQQAEWLQACKSGTSPSCTFEYSAALTEANHLGNVAYRLGRKIQWDSAALRCPDAPEADRYLKREYRKGWELT